MGTLSTLIEGVRRATDLEEAGDPKAKLVRAIYKKFPPDSKMKRGGKLKVMLTGDTAKVLGKKDMTTVALDDLQDAELKKLAALWKIKTEGLEEAAAVPMDAEGFIADVKKQARVKDRQLSFSHGALGGKSMVFVNLINLPHGIGSAGGGAEAANNRFAVSIDGFTKEGGAPPSGKVKLKGLVGYGFPTLRGKTGTPQQVAKALANHLTKIVKEVEPRYTHTKREDEGKYYMMTFSTMDPIYLRTMQRTKKGYKLLQVQMNGNRAGKAKITHLNDLDLRKPNAKEVDEKDVPKNVLGRFKEKMEGVEEAMTEQNSKLRAKLLAYIKKHASEAEPIAVDDIAAANGFGDFSADEIEAEITAMIKDGVLKSAEESAEEGDTSMSKSSPNVAEACKKKLKGLSKKSKKGEMPMESVDFMTTNVSLDRIRVELEDKVLAAEGVDLSEMLPNKARDARKRYAKQAKHGSMAALAQKKKERRAGKSAAGREKMKMVFGKMRKTEDADLDEARLSISDKKARHATMQRRRASAVKRGKRSLRPGEKMVFGKVVRRPRGMSASTDQEGYELDEKKGKKSMEPGGGGRFAKLKAQIAKKGGVDDPAAVAAAIGRKKYGKKKFQQMAAKGRARASGG